MAEANTASTNRETHSLRDVLEGFFFYVGIPALTLYPLGFVALCLQMWRDQEFPYSWDFGGFNFGITWYTASLVPKVVVMGTGVRLLFLSLLACVLAMGVSSLAFNFLQRRWHVQQRWHLLEAWTGSRKREVMFWRLSFVTLLPLAVYIIWNDFDIDSWYDAPFLAAFVLLSAAAGTVLIHARHREGGRRFLHGLAVAYAGAVLAALSLSALQLPDLPQVELKAEAESWPLRPADEPFVLLSQEAGYWHVYNRTRGLLAVPDDEAKVVRQWDETKANKPAFDADRDDQRS